MTAAPPTRILLADDHALVRQGVKLILDSEPDFSVVAEAADGVEAVDLVRSTEVDLAVLDIAMPRLTGLQAARQIARRRPAPRILLLSMYDNEQYLFEALRAGASGYVLKSAVDQDLIQACRSAIREEPFLYPQAMATLMRNYLQRAQDGRAAPAKILTEREEQVLKLIAEGNSSRDIAEQLVLSLKTVERHRANILQKLRMRDRTDLTRYAVRSGLIEP